MRCSDALIKAAVYTETTTKSLKQAHPTHPSVDSLRSPIQWMTRLWRSVSLCILLPPSFTFIFS